MLDCSAISFQYSYIREAVLDPLAARTDHIVLNAEDRNTK